MEPIPEHTPRSDPEPDEGAVVGTDGRGRRGEDAPGVARLPEAAVGETRSRPEDDAGDESVTHDIGRFIRQQRERTNLSLRKLADRAGISNPYLSQIERGIRKPSAEILKRLSRALEISAESLYTRAGLIEAGPPAPTVVEAVEADRALSPRQKQVLLDLYRALVEASGTIDDH